jgi:hypothetical protein
MLDNERDDIYTVRVPKILLHRGNNGVDNLPENYLDTIFKRNNEGYSVECDIWFRDNKWYLEHDELQYELQNLEVFLAGITNLIHAKMERFLQNY